MQDRRKCRVQYFSGVNPCRKVWGGEILKYWGNTPPPNTTKIITSCTISLFSSFFTIPPPQQKKQHAQETATDTQLTRNQSESHGYHKDDTQKDKGTNNTDFNKPNFPFLCTNYSIIIFSVWQILGGRSYGPSPPPGPKCVCVCGGGGYISPIPGIYARAIFNRLTTVYQSMKKVLG